MKNDIVRIDKKILNQLFFSTNFIADDVQDFVHPNNCSLQS